MLPRQIISIFLLIISAVQSGESLQKASAPGSAPSRPASNPNSNGASSKAATAPADPAAAALLAEASRRRAPRGEEEIADVIITMAGELNLQDQHNEFEAEHQFLVPNRIKSKITTNSSAVEQGFDGSNFWIRHGGEVERLSGRDKQVDIDKIQDSIRITNRLLKLVQITQLAKEIDHLRRVAEEGGAPPRVRGDMREFPSLIFGTIRAAVVTLTFARETLDLVEVRAEMGSTVETIEFSQISEVNNTRFPFRVTAWSRDRAQPEYKVQISKVRWNLSLKPADFVVLK